MNNKPFYQIEYRQPHDPEDNYVAILPDGGLLVPVPSHEHLLEMAWVVIANASDWHADQNDWHLESKTEWVVAATRWREEYFATLPLVKSDSDIAGLLKELLAYAPSWAIEKYGLRDEVGEAIDILKGR